MRRRILAIAAVVLVLAVGAGVLLAQVMAVRAWAQSLDEGRTVLVLVEESLSGDVERILAPLRGPGGLSLVTVPSQELGALAAELAPALIVAPAGIEDQLPAISSPASGSYLLQVTFSYRVEARTVQPWILVSAFPDGLAGHIDLELATRVLASEPLIPGREVLTRDRLLTEGVTGLAVGLALPGDRRPDLQAWAVDGVWPDRRAWLDGTYALGRDVVILARQGDASGLLSAVAARWLLPDDVQETANAGAPVRYLTGDDARNLWWGSGPEVRLTAIGDVMLARRVDRRIDEHGLDYPFARVRDRLAWGDVVIANLESPLGVTGQPIPNKVIWFRARPETVTTLVDAGIDIVSLANNHSMDYDIENFLETLDILDDAGIMYVGGGRNLQEARSPLVVERDGLRIAFLAYNAFAHIFWSRSYPLTFEAGPEKPGTAPLRDEVFDWIEEDIRRARGVADIVIVYHHWGEEYRNHPDGDQVRWGRWTVDAGADLVLGSHPHAIQGIEIYRGVPIAYSLGNFVFDQNRPITTESMILELVLTADGVAGFNVVPVRIVDDQPRVLGGPEAEELLEKVRSISRDLGGEGR